MASTNIKVASRILCSYLHCPGNKSPVISNCLDTGGPNSCAYYCTTHILLTKSSSKNSKYILNNNLHFLFLLYFILVSNIHWIWDISLRVICFPCYTPFKKPKFSYSSDYHLEIVSGLELGAFFISDLELHLMYSYRNGAQGLSFSEFICVLVLLHFEDLVCLLLLLLHKIP